MLNLVAIPLLVVLVRLIPSAKTEHTLTLFELFLHFFLPKQLGLPYFAIIFFISTPLRVSSQAKLRYPMEPFIASL